MGARWSRPASPEGSTVLSKPPKAKGLRAREGGGGGADQQVRKARRFYRSRQRQRGFGRVPGQPSEPGRLGGKGYLRRFPAALRGPDGFGIAHARRGVRGVSPRRVLVSAGLLHAGDVDDRAGIAAVHPHRSLVPRSRGSATLLL